MKPAPEGKLNSRTDCTLSVISRTSFVVTWGAQQRRPLGVRTGLHEASFREFGSTVPNKESEGRAPLLVASGAAEHADSQAHLPIAVEVQQVPILPLHLGPARRRAACKCKSYSSAFAGALRTTHRTKVRWEAGQW